MENQQKNNKNIYNYSDFIINSLKKEGFSVQNTEQISGARGLFPDDISLTVRSSKKAEKKSTLSNLIFSFTHDFYLKNTDFVVSLINLTEQAKLPYDVTFLFSQENNEKLLPEKKNMPSGTSFFERYNYEYENMCAIAIYENVYDRPEIITSGTNSYTPKWLVQTVKNSFAQNNLDLNVPGLGFNELNISRKRVRDFLDMEIPCAGIPVYADEAHLNLLSSLEENLCSQTNLEWNNHYAFIPTGTTGFWLSETFFVLIYIIFALISIFALSFSSVKLNAKNNATLKDFSRNWYLILLKIAAISLIVFIMNLIFCRGRTANIINIGLRNTFVLAAGAFLMALQIRKKYKFSYAVTEYELLIISTLNVLIFTSVKFTYMTFFLIQYIAVVLFRRSKNLIVNIFVFLILYVFSFFYLQSVNLEKIYENVFIALALYPAIVQSQRIFVLAHILDQSQKKNFIKSQLITVMSIFMLFIFSYIPMYFAKTYQNRTGLFVHKIENVENDSLALSIKENKIYDFSNNILLIESEKDPVRYNIYFESKNSQIIGECSFEYEIINSGRAEIVIPDVPPKNLEIIFTTSALEKLTVTVEAFYLNEEGKVYSQTASIKGGDLNA